MHSDRTASVSDISYPLKLSAPLSAYLLQPSISREELHGKHGYLHATEGRICWKYELLSIKTKARVMRVCQGNIDI